MNNEPTHISETIADLFNPEHVREVLDRPFDQKAIKTRPGHFGQTLSYVEAHQYIHRLNEAFGVAWSFQIIQHEIMDQEVLVLGKLTALGHVRMAFGGSSITRVKETGELVSIADDLKAAATDAFKKACSFLGVGLHLYSDDQAKNPAPKISGNGNGQAKGNGNGRLTSRQLEAILSIGREKGLDREQVRQMALDRYDRNLEFVTKQEASSLIKELQNNQ